MITDEWFFSSRLAFIRWKQHKYSTQRTSNLPDPSASQESSLRDPSPTLPGSIQLSSRTLFLTVVFLNFFVHLHMNNGQPFHFHSPYSETFRKLSTQPRGNMNEGHSCLKFILLGSDIWGHGDHSIMAIATSKNVKLYFLNFKIQYVDRLTDCILLLYSDIYFRSYRLVPDRNYVHSNF